MWTVYLTSFDNLFLFADDFMATVISHCSVKVLLFGIVCLYSLVR